MSYTHHPIPPRARIALLCLAAIALALTIPLFFLRPVATPNTITVSENLRPQTISTRLSIEHILLEETIAIESDTTALDLLTQASALFGFTIKTKEYSGLGSLIETIGAYENGTNEKYWQYYINGMLAPVGAGAYVLQADDVIEWKFAEFETAV